uniref:exodeoxyribonuclease III n=1 Tax=Phallusia mammillata TaxID=59560 RepID=A0A6F9DN24_9ASCI|nr:pol-like protein [Phallusia mammillata]
MVSYLKVLSLNVNGITETTKRRVIFDHIRESKANIIFLQETLSKPQEEARWTKEWTCGCAAFNSNSETEQRKNGVAILTNSTNLVISNNNTDTRGRIITAQIDTGIQYIQLVNIYAPSGGTNRIENKIFFDNLYPYVHSTHPIIFGGDFNNIEDPNLDCFPPRPDHRLNKPLQQIMRTFSLKDAYRTLHPNGNQFTRHSTQTHSRLDRLYTSPEITPEKQIFKSNPLSDHDTIILTTRIPLKHGSIRTAWKNNVKNFVDHELIFDLEAKYTEWKALATDLTENPLQLWLFLKTKIKLLLIKHSKRITQENRREIQDLQQSLERIRQELENTPTKEKLKTYNERKKQLKIKLIQRQRENILKSLADDINYKHMADKTVYSSIKERKTQSIIQ